jgi:hypothetical protein
MNAIRARRWLLATYALGLAAIAMQIASLHWAAQGMVGTARATEARHQGAAETVLESMRQTSRAAAHHSDQLSLIGLGLAALAGLSLLLSTVNHEPGWRLLALAVLVAYVLVSLLMV